MTDARTSSFSPVESGAPIAAGPDDAPQGPGNIAEDVAAAVPGSGPARAPDPSARHGAVRGACPVRQRLAAGDRAAARLVGVRLPHPPLLTRVLGVVSRSADHGYIWYAMAAVPLIARRPRGGARFAYVAGGVLGGEITNFAVKIAVRRQRPSQAPEDGGSYIKLPSTHSFPSAHATMGMVGLATMGRLSPRLKAPLTVLVALLAFTRAYLRVHYPADVVAGLGMGALVAAVYTRLVCAPRPSDYGLADGGRS